MKKILALALAILMLVGVFAACAPASDPEPTPSQEGDPTPNVDDDSAEPVNLVIAARGGSHVDVINAVKGTFEAENNCTIEVLGLENEDLKQKVALDSKNAEGAYDLVMLDDPWMPEFSSANLLLNMTEAGYELDTDFVTKSSDIGKEPYGTGDVFALPFAGNVTLLFYNDALLTELDAEVPDNWEAVLEIAKASEAAGKIGYVCRAQQGNPIVGDYIPVLWAYGGDIFDETGAVVVDSPEALAALEMYIQLLANGENFEKNDIVSSVSDGSAAMSLGWPSWYISGKDATAAYARIPGKVGADSEDYASGVIGNWMMGVTSNTTNTDLAIELVKYLTSAEVQKEAAAVGAVPTRTSVFEDEALAAEYAYYGTLLDGTENSRVRPRTPLWSAIENVYGIELSNAITGAKDPAQALADAKVAIEKIME